MALTLVGCDAPTSTDAPEAPTLDGSVYVLNTGGLTIDGAEEGLNTLARGLFTAQILMRVDNATETGFDVDLTFGTDEDPIRRDACTASVPYTGLTLDGIDFVGAPQDVTIDRVLGPVQLSNVAVQGRFSPDQDTMTQLTVSGSGDLRAADGTTLGPATSLCETFAALNLPCQPCADGAITCLDLTITGLGATRIPDLDFEREPDPLECIGA